MDSSAGKPDWVWTAGAKTTVQTSLMTAGGNVMSARALSAFLEHL